MANAKRATQDAMKGVMEGCCSLCWTHKAVFAVLEAHKADRREG